MKICICTRCGELYEAEVTGDGPACPPCPACGEQETANALCGSEGCDNVAVAYNNDNWWTFCMSCLDAFRLGQAYPAVQVRVLE